MQSNAMTRKSLRNKAIISRSSNSESTTSHSLNESVSTIRNSTTASKIKNNKKKSCSSNKKAITSSFSNEGESYTTKRRKISSTSKPQNGALSALQLAGEVTKEHLYSINTQRVYSSHLERAKEIVKTLDDGDLQEAFYTLSSQTPDVLLLIVYHRIEVENRGYSTAEGMQAAFKQYYKDKFNCTEEWWKVDGKGKCSGNPVYAKNFVEYMKAIKKRDARLGTSSRNLLF